MSTHFKIVCPTCGAVIRQCRCADANKPTTVADMPCTNCLAKRAPLETAEVRCRMLGKLLKDTMPPGWGFTLALVSYGEDGFCTYISSVEREGAVKMLRELLDRIDKGTDDV